MQEWQKKIMFLLGMNSENIVAAAENIGKLWIAQIDMGTEGVSIELELDPDTIAFSIMVPLLQTEQASEFLKNELNDMGVRIAKNYEDYERGFLEANE